MNASQQEARKKELRPASNAVRLFVIDTNAVCDDATRVMTRFFLDLLKSVLEEMPE